MTTQWIKITEQDLQTVLTKTQLDLLKAEAMRNNNVSICPFKQADETTNPL